MSFHAIGLASYIIIVCPYNLEINKSTVPSGSVDLFANQMNNNPAITSPVPQPAQMTSGVFRSNVLPGSQFVKGTNSQFQFHSESATASLSSHTAGSHNSK